MLYSRYYLPFSPWGSSSPSAWQDSPSAWGCGWQSPDLRSSEFKRKMVMRPKDVDIFLAVVLCNFHTASLDTLCSSLTFDISNYVSSISDFVLCQRATMCFLQIISTVDHEPTCSDGGFLAGPPIWSFAKPERYQSYHAILLDNELKDTLLVRILSLTLYL